MEFDSLNALSASYGTQTYKAPEPQVQSAPAAAEAVPTPAPSHDGAEHVVYERPAPRQSGESAAQPGDELASKINERNKKANDEKFLAKAIQEANKKLAGTNSEFHCSVHKKTNTIMIKVVNAETKETIREIPPEKTLDAVAKMWELAGILVDEKR